MNIEQKAREDYWPKNLGHCEKCNRDINMMTHSVALFTGDVICIKEPAIAAALQSAVAEEREECAINGCYCVCHSEVSSRPSCVHCHPELYEDKVDPYCGLNAKGVARIRARGQKETA